MSNLAKLDNVQRITINWRQDMYNDVADNGDKCLRKHWSNSLRANAQYQNNDNLQSINKVKRKLAPLMEYVWTFSLYIKTRCLYLKTLINTFLLVLLFIFLFSRLKKTNNFSVFYDQRLFTHDPQQLTSPARRLRRRLDCDWFLKIILERA